MATRQGSQNDRWPSYFPGVSDISDGLPTGYTREKRPATRLETVEAILDKSARRIRAVPLQRAFIQSGERKEAMPGPLARFVSRHDDTALRGYLLALAGASAPPFDIKQPADVWARALDLDLVGVSKMWARLERLGLIGRRREGRRSVITILREDGSGLTYTHPFLLEPKRPYVKIPFIYWTSGLEARLSLPARAVFLIALTHRGWFTLPAEKAPAWYGISADSFERGVDALKREEVLRTTPVYKTAPLAPRGYTRQTAFLLLPPYGSRRLLVPPASTFTEPAEVTAT